MYDVYIVLGVCTTIQLGPNVSGNDKSVQKSELLCKLKPVHLYTGEML